MASKRKDYLLEMLLYEVDLYAIISYLNITENFLKKFSSVNVFVEILMIHLTFEKRYKKILARKS
jgi:hypothetical protein